jgi:2,4-dienoyl-CoA reductase-like NADH-dependent reductase (Old Yellow Enzyme family)
VKDFASAATLAVEAGADGVEIHGANGYLVQQFLSSNANLRSDRYGGSIENRIRFAVEVAKATAEAIGPSRVGIRLSPGGTFNDIVEDDARALYAALVAALAPLGLAYLHVVHPRDEGLGPLLPGRVAGSAHPQPPGRALRGSPGGRRVGPGRRRLGRAARARQPRSRQPTEERGGAQPA